MASLISTAERKDLFTRIYHVLGFGIRKVELTDEQLDTLFINSLEDYSKYINDWLIDQQWSTLSGLNIEEADFNVAFSTKDLNFVKSFTYAYSRQVGLGTNAPASENWELKKDYIIITANTQNYTIPKGREVNEVLWSTPSFMVYDTLNPVGWVSNEYGWSVGGTPLGYVTPAYSSMLSAADRSMKNKIMKSELTYRITGNANGTKNLHLYPVPGGRYQPRGLGNYFSTDVDGMYVWYFYYDTNSKNKNKCLNQNNDIAIVTRPTDVPISNLTWGKLNAPAKTWIRQYMTASAKILLAYIRGKYSGNLNITDASIQMDYAFLLEDGRTEKENLMTELKERLDSLTYENQLTKRANEAEQLNKVLGYSPLPIIVI